MDLVIEAIAKVYIPERVRELCEGDWLAEEARRSLLQDKALWLQTVITKALDDYPTKLTEEAWNAVALHVDTHVKVYAANEVHNALKEAKRELRGEMREWNDRYPMRCPDRRDGC